MLPAARFCNKNARVVATVRLPSHGLWGFGKIEKTNGASTLAFYMYKSAYTPQGELLVTGLFVIGLLVIG